MCLTLTRYVSFQAPPGKDKVKGEGIIKFT